MDDNAPMHPKLIAVSPDAAWLWFCGICYCHKHATDGAIPISALTKLSHVKRPRPAAAELVRVGLWTPSEHGWDVHDYVHWQPSGRQVKQKRAATAARVKRWRDLQNGVFADTSDASNAVGNGVRNAVGNGVGNAPSSLPFPSVPLQREEIRSGPSGPGGFEGPGAPAPVDLAALDWGPPVPTIASPPVASPIAPTPVQAPHPPAAVQKGHVAPIPSRDARSVHATAGLPGVSVAPTVVPTEKVKADQKYAMAYAKGMEMGAPGTRFPPIRRGDEDRALRDVCAVFALHPDKSPIRGDALLDWITAAARAYRVARPNADFEQGWSHRKFLEWHRKGCPVEARAVAPRVPIQTPTGAPRAWRTHDERTGERHENDRRTGGGIDEKPADGTPVRAVR